MSNISFIGVPFECGSDRKGTAKAPEWLWRYGAIDSTPAWIDMHLLPNDEQYHGIKNYQAVLQTCLALRDAVFRVYQSKRNLCVIGGDHSIALGSIAGVLQHEPNIGVIWFDAHGDVNTEATSPSMNAHGMPVAALLGICQSGINDIATTHLKPQNIFWVGARDLDLGEIETLMKLGIKDNVYTTEQIHRVGMTTIMADIQQKMERQHIPALHLSFDIDGMDPSFVWATGTRVEDGLIQEDFDAFLEGLSLFPEMRSMDFVEYNPILDDAEKTTGKWCVENFKRLIERM